MDTSHRLPHPPRRDAPRPHATARRPVLLLLPAALVLTGGATAWATLGAPPTLDAVSTASPATAASAADAATAGAPAHPDHPEHDDHEDDHDHDRAPSATAPPGDVSATPDHHGLIIHDNTGGRAATAEDQAAADAFAAEVAAGVARYQDVTVAEADGYRMNREAMANSWNHLKHYSRRTGDGDWFDPTRPGGLIYRIGDDGSATLCGVYFVSPPGTTDDQLPQPGGPLTVWHDHSAKGCPTTAPDCTGLGNADPPKMLHVWLFDGVVVPFAHEYPDAAGIDRTAARRAAR